MKTVDASHFMFFADVTTAALQSAREGHHTTRFIRKDPNDPKDEIGIIFDVRLRQIGDMKVTPELMELLASGPALIARSLDGLKTERKNDGND